MSNPKASGLGGTPPGRAMAGILELSLFFVILGARGFTRDGLPFSARRRLAGTTGKAVGAACLLFGLSGIALAYWAGDAGDRLRLRLIGLGISIGVLGVFIVRPPMLPASHDEGDEPATNPDRV